MTFEDWKKLPHVMTEKDILVWLQATTEDVLSAKFLRVQNDTVREQLQNLQVEHEEQVGDQYPRALETAAMRFIKALKGLEIVDDSDKSLFDVMRTLTEFLLEYPEYVAVALLW